MRDPGRIDPVIAALSQAWKANPDLRLTQLVWHLAGAPNDVQFYNTEDEPVRQAAVRYATPRGGA